MSRSYFDYRYPAHCGGIRLLIGAVLILSQNAPPVTAYWALVVDNGDADSLLRTLRKRPH